MSPQYDWRQLAELHRPTDGAVMVAAIQKMHQSGLTARDISDTLRIGLAAVHQALNQTVAPC